MKSTMGSLKANDTVVTRSRKLAVLRMIFLQKRTLSKSTKKNEITVAVHQNHHGNIWKPQFLLANNSSLYTSLGLSKVLMAVQSSACPQGFFFLFRANNGSAHVVYLHFICKWFHHVSSVVDKLHISKRVVWKFANALFGVSKVSVEEDLQIANCHAF